MRGIYGPFFDHRNIGGGMANIHRLIFLLFLSFLSFNSFAAFNKVYIYYVEIGGQSHSSQSYSDLCDIAYAFYSSGSAKPSNWASSTFTTTICSESSYEGYRTGVDLNGNSVGGERPYDYYRVGFSRYLSCPKNSTSSGFQCICNSGYEEKNGNSCVLPEPPDPCEGLNEFCAGQFMSETSWDTSGNSHPGSVCKKPSQNIVGGSGGTTPRFPGCNRGCSVETYPGVVKYQSPFDDSWRTSGDGKYNGQSCNSDSETVTPEEPKPEEPKPEDELPCKNGEFSGHVNGIKTCLASKAKNTDGTTTKKTNSDGSTTETTSTTTCSNGSCNTTITTVNKNSSGATTGTSAEVVKETEGEFCQKNPASPICKSDSGTGKGEGKGEGEEDGKGSEFGGSCSSGFTCERGDGIACAIAKKQHEDSCALNEATEESALYQQSKGKDGNVTGDLEGNSTYQFTQIKSNSRFSASSCVQDLNITVWGTSVEIPLSKVCPWLSNLGYVLVAVAWIMAAAIVMRGR